MIWIDIINVAISITNKKIKIAYEDINFFCYYFCAKSI